MLFTMLSSPKNYLAVSKKVDEDLNGMEENHDDTNMMVSRESSSTKHSSGYVSGNVETQNNTDLSGVSSNSIEDVSEEVEEISDNTIGEEEMSDNPAVDDDLNKSSFPTPSRKCNQSSSDRMSKCTSPTGSFEGLLSSKQSSQLSVEDSDDDEFPLSSTKASSSEDLLDKYTLKSNRDKDSTIKSESPSSDVEFSACSSVTSCTEDSGISSTVRDDDLEEIPLNSSRFSPELYKQISRLSVDETVAAWIPQSSNTYAPSPNAKMITETDGSKPLKHKKLK